MKAFWEEQALSISQRYGGYAGLRQEIEQLASLAFSEGHKAGMEMCMDAVTKHCLQEADPTRASIIETLYNLMRGEK